jgi:GH18 family chitinase
MKKKIKKNKKNNNNKEKTSIVKRTSRLSGTEVTEPKREKQKQNWKSRLIISYYSSWLNQGLARKEKEIRKVGII